MNETQTSTAQPSVSDKPVEPVRKCQVNQVLTHFIIQLLKEAPLNPHSRTLAHNALKVPLPDSAQTFQQIVDWIEFNVDPPKGDVPKLQATPGQEFDISVEVTMTEYGRCSYSRQMRGTSSYGLTTQDLTIAAERAINWGDFYSRVQAMASDYAAENPPDTDQVGSVSTSEHDSEDTQDFSAVAHFGSVPRQRLMEFMRAHMPTAVTMINNRQNQL